MWVKLCSINKGSKARGWGCYHLHYSIFILIDYYVNFGYQGLVVILIMFIWVPYLMRIILQLDVLVFMVLCVVLICKGGTLVIGCLSSSILFKHESRWGQLFVLSWARVRRVALGSIVSECCTVSGMCLWLWRLWRYVLTMVVWMCFMFVYL